MKLTITPEDIENAEHDSWDNCPIARAAKRTWPGNKIEVYDTQISVNGRDFYHSPDTSRVMEVWDSFDEIDDECSIVHPEEIEFPNVSSALV